MDELAEAALNATSMQKRVHTSEQQYCRLPMSEPCHAVLTQLARHETGRSHEYATVDASPAA
jgi:hypothetical protein